MTPPALNARSGSETAPQNKEDKMRYVETAAVGLVALATQMLVVATVFM